MRGRKAQVTSEINLLKKNRKQLDDSIYTFVDKILIKHGIIRAAYHGGDFNGVGILFLWIITHEIMTEIKGHLSKCAKKS